MSYNPGSGFFGPTQTLVYCDIKDPKRSGFWAWTSQKNEVGNAGVQNESGGCEDARTIPPPELVGQIAEGAMAQVRHPHVPVGLKSYQFRFDNTKKENMTSIQRDGQLSLTIVRISQNCPQYDTWKEDLKKKKEKR